MKRLKIVLIDDNKAYRNYLKTLLVKNYDAIILGEASNSDEAYEIENLFTTDLIFMDVLVPGKSSIEFTKELLWQNHLLKIIAVAQHFDKLYLISLLGAGFKGCILKNDLGFQLEDALSTVCSGSLFFPKQIQIHC